MTGRDQTTTGPLRASEAARRLDVPTCEIIRLIYQHELRYVMVNDIAHIPADALEEYRARARKAAFHAGRRLQARHAAVVDEFTFRGDLIGELRATYCGSSGAGTRRIQA